MNTASIRPVVLLLVALQAVAADEWPELKQGLWSFQQTILSGDRAVGTPNEIQQCTNPSDDMRKKWSALAAKGCEFSSLKHQGSLYSYTSICAKDGLPIRTQSNVMVMSDSDYRVMSQTQNGTQIARVRVIAHRLGDCTEQAG